MSGFSKKQRWSKTKTKLNKKDLKRFYIKERRSIRDIANILGCSKDMVYQSLKKYEIQRRSHVEKRSKLQEYDLSFLKKEIRKKGFNEVAYELGVHNTTLRRYIKKRQGKDSASVA
jgi:predicted transcriptional regulator